MNITDIDKRLFEIRRIAAGMRHVVKATNARPDVRYARMKDAINDMTDHLVEIRMQVIADLTDMAIAETLALPFDDALPMLMTHLTRNPSLVTRRDVGEWLKRNAEAVHAYAGMKAKEAENKDQ